MSKLCLPHTSATLFCLLSCLLLLCFSTTSSSQINKPHFWGVHSAGTGAIVNTHPTDPLPACKDYSAQYWADVVQKLGGGNSVVSTDCLPTSNSIADSQQPWCMPGAGSNCTQAGSVSYTYLRRGLTMTAVLSNSVGTLSNPTVHITAAPYCRPNIFWSPTVQCDCLDVGGNRVDSGYWDKGVSADSFTTAPFTWCRSTSLTSSTGCAIRRAQYGPWSASVKGVRHWYDGVVYTGTPQSCSPTEKQPELQDTIGSDQCPVGYSYKPQYGAEVCVKNASISVPTNTSGACVKGDPCWFEPTDVPVAPNAPTRPNDTNTPITPPSTTPPGTTPPAGSPDPNTPTGSSWWSGVCNVPGIKSICEFFQAPPSNTMYQEGLTATAGTTQLTLPTITAPSAPQATGYTNTSGQCPAPRQINTQWGVIEYSYSAGCDLALMIRPVIVLVALALALFYVFGFKQG
jgi:Neisseria meningitidis TspB protein